MSLVASFDTSFVDRSTSQFRLSGILSKFLRELSVAANPLKTFYVPQVMQRAELQ